MLVPFPFTDLSGRKRRSTLVVSPERFRRDLILCAITSQVPERLSEWEVALSAEDLAEGNLPKPSVIRVAKLFTMHTGLIVGGNSAMFRRTSFLRFWIDSKSYSENLPKPKLE